MFSNIKISIILLSILYTVTSIYSCNSKKINSADFSTNPDSVVAAKINDARVVMLGEIHDDYLIYNSLINVLKYWIDGSHHEMGEKKTLNLVLEIDSVTAYYFDYSIKTGNDSLFFEKILPFATLEFFEFYSNLSRLNKYIDSLNTYANTKLTLNIKGFEEIGLINIDENYYRKNQRENELWFVNERDKNISEKLIRFIKNNESNNFFLIQYGGAHLRTRFGSKNLGFNLPDSLTNGYYLAYYLRHEFGDSNVVLFNNGMFNENLYKGTDLEKYADKNVLIPSARFPLNDSISDPFSFIILRPFHQPISHSFGNIFSRFILNKLYESTEVFEKLLPGFKAQQFYYGNLQKIYFATGKKFDNTEQLQNWLKTEPEYDGFERFDSKEFADLIYHIYKDSSGKVDKRRIFNDFGFLGNDFIYYSNDSLKWFNEWQQINQNAKFVNAIGIYWVGYPNEKIKAKKYLIEYSGQDFKEPEKYLQWYRKKAFNSDE